jgi:hypothetical protein
MKDRGPLSANPRVGTLRTACSAVLRQQNNALGVALASYAAITCVPSGTAQIGQICLIAWAMVGRLASATGTGNLR